MEAISLPVLGDQGQPRHREFTPFLLSLATWCSTELDSEKVGSKSLDAGLARRVMDTFTHLLSFKRKKYVGQYAFQMIAKGSFPGSLQVHAHRWKKNKLFNHIIIS